MKLAGVNSPSLPCLELFSESNIFQNSDCQYLECFIVFEEICIFYTTILIHSNLIGFAQVPKITIGNGWSLTEIQHLDQNSTRNNVQDKRTETFDDLFAKSS